MNIEMNSFERGEFIFKVKGLNSLLLKKVFLCDLAKCLDAITDFYEYLKMDEFTKKPVIVLEGQKEKEKYSIVYDNNDSVKVVGQNLDGLNDSKIAYSLEAISLILSSMNVLYAISGDNIIVEKISFNTDVSKNNKAEKLKLFL